MGAFDEFDKEFASKAPVKSDPFAEFDAEFAPKEKTSGRTIGGTAKDLAIAGAKSIVSVPEMAVGLADLVTKGKAGKAVEKAGVRFKETKEILDSYKSEAQKEADSKFKNAEGIVDSAKAAIENPSIIVNAGVESVAPMLAGGVFTKGALAVAPKLGYGAAAIGEGVAAAGSQAESTRQQTKDGELTGKQAALAGASGVGTSIFGALGGKLAQKLKIADIDAVAAGLNITPDEVVKKAFARKLVEGGIAEGIFEEMPQSVQEQMLSNYALDKPVMDGVDKAAVLGTLTGGVMGAGAQAMPKSQSKIDLLRQQAKAAKEKLANIQAQKSQQPQVSDDALLSEVTQATQAAPDSPTPEPTNTLEAQATALNEGRKPAILLTEGEQAPSGLDADVKAAQTDNGALLYKDDSVLQQAQSGDVGVALGYGISQKPQNATDVITARDENGTVIQDVATDGSQSVIDSAQSVAGLNGTVEQRPVEAAIAEREQENDPITTLFNDNLTDFEESIATNNPLKAIKQTLGYERAFDYHDSVKKVRDSSLPIQARLKALTEIKKVKRELIVLNANKSQGGNNVSEQNVRSNTAMVNGPAEISSDNAQGGEGNSLYLNEQPTGMGDVTRTFSGSISNDLVDGIGNGENSALRQAFNEQAPARPDALTINEAKVDNQPSKFGMVFKEFYRNAKGAVAKLMQEKGGDAVGALHHPEVGDIDLIWGKEGTQNSDGFGLAKIAKWHPEVVNDLQGVISSLKVVRKNTNRIQLESVKHKASVRLELDGVTKSWLLTAFEKQGGSSTRTDTTANEIKDDTARLESNPNNTINKSSSNVNISKARQSKQSGTLLTKLRDLGGIKLSDKLDVAGEAKSLAPGGYNQVFTGKSKTSLRGLIESGDLDEYLPYNMRLQGGNNAEAYDSAEAYDYISERIKSGDRILKYEEEEELRASQYFQAQADSAQESDLVDSDINNLLKEAGYDERERDAHNRIYEQGNIDETSQVSEQGNANIGIVSAERSEAGSESRTGSLGQTTPNEVTRAPTSREREGVRPLVESIVKRRAAAAQMNKSKAFDEALKNAKAFMNGETVKPLKFSFPAATFISDPQLSNALRALYDMAKAPAKEARQDNTALIESYKQQINDAKGKADLTKLAKAIQDDKSLDDANASTLDDLVMDAIDALDVEDVATMDSDSEKATLPSNAQSDSDDKTIQSKNEKINESTLIKAPDGSYDFGEITPEMSKEMKRQAGNIRLQHGIQNADGTGYGLVHIKANHEKQIINAGFNKVEDFVAHVSSKFNQILKAEAGQLLVAVKDGRKDVMFIQLTPDKDSDFYRINTAFPASRDYLEKQQRKGMKSLWEGSEPTSAAAGKRPLYAANPENETSQDSPIAQSQSDNQTIRQENSESNTDLLGDNTKAKQAIADAERAKDTKRNEGADNQGDFKLTSSDSEADKAAASWAQPLFSRNKKIDTDDVRESAIQKSLIDLDNKLEGVVLFSRNNTDSRISPTEEYQNRLRSSVQKNVDKLTKGWKNAPQIEVVYDMNDTRIRKAVRDENERQLSQGATGNPEGFYDNGKVYIVASEMYSPNDVARVLFHESLGHQGLQGVFGKSLDGVLDNIYMGRRKEVLAKAEQYGLDFTNKKDRRIASEEVLAEMAQSNPQIGYVKRAIAAIRNWLRENVPYFKNMEFTDADIIQAYILPARNFVINGGKSNSAVNNSAFIHGDELGKDLTLKELKAKTLEWAKENLSGKTFKTKDGNEIIVSTKGIKHTLIFAMTDLTKSLLALPEIINNSELIRTEKDKLNRPEVISVEKYSSSVQIGDNKYDVVMTAFVFKDGTRYYDHGVIKNKSPALSRTDTVNSKYDTDTSSRAIGSANESDNNTNKNERQAQTETEAFKNWFVDSKVVDADGKPVVVYHGTGKDFNEFKPNNRGVYFVTPSSKFANRYAGAEYSIEVAGDSPMILPVYVSAQNPFDFENTQHVKKLAQQASLGAIAVSEIKAGKWSRIEDRTTLQSIKKLGFDGVYVKEEGVKNLAVFEPNQIKSAIGNSGDFNPANPDIRFSRAHSTEDIPDAIILNPLGSAKNSADYELAKAGDVEAATRLAKELVTDDVINKLAELKNNADLIVGVTSIEASGTNALPEAAALLIAEKLGIQYDENILQSTSPKRTGMNGLDRIFSRPVFEGDVKDGAGYIFVDDTITQGGTFAALSFHVKDGGGKVIGNIALTGKAYSSKIAVSDNLLKLTRSKFGDLENEFKQITGYGFDGLTSSEARYIAAGISPDKFRDRIIAETQKRTRNSNTPITGESKNVINFSRSNNGNLDLIRDNAVEPNGDLPPTETKGISQEALANLGKRMSQGTSTSKGGTEPSSLLNLFDTNQVVEMYKDALPELIFYKTLKNKEVADRNKVMEHSDKLLNRLKKLNKADRDVFAHIAHEATLDEVDPSKPYAQSRNIKGINEAIDKLAEKSIKAPLTQRQAELMQLSKARISNHKEIYEDLRARYLAMNETAQALFVDLKNAYVDNAKLVFNQLEARVNRMGVDSASNSKVIADLRKEFDQLKNGIYFPLARFGDHVVIGTKLVNNIPSKVVEYYEKESLAKAGAKRMEVDGYKVKVSARKEAMADNKSNESIANIINQIKEMKQVGVEPNLDDLLDSVNQAMIQMLPDQSYRRHYLHRKNTPGYSNDFIRAYADSMWKSANHISALVNGDAVRDTINKMQQRIDETENGDVAPAQDVVNSIIKREELAMQQTSAIAAFAGQLGFVSALGSVSNFFVNLTQTPTLTFPWLGARFGYMNASLALSKSLKDVTLSIQKATTLDELEKVIDVRKNLSGKELEAMNVVFESGKIDLTQAYDLIDAANNETVDRDSIRQKAMRVAAIPQHLSENINRQASALATIRLAFKINNAPPKYAAAAAIAALDETHYNYEKWNRAPIMQGNAKRVLFMFKQYAQKTMYLYAHTAMLAVGKDRGARKVALKQLAGMVVMQTSFAGVLGLPIFAEALVVGGGIAGFKVAGKKGAYLGAATGLALAVMAALGGDEDKEEFETEVRNYLHDNLGKTGADVISKGLPRLLGVDIAGRLDASEMIVRRPDRSLPEGEQLMELTNSLLGYTYGYVSQLAMGMNHLSNGEWDRAVEKMIPIKQVRDLFKGYRYETNGVKSRKGDTLIEDVSMGETIAQAIGFTPARAADQYAANSAIGFKKRLIEGEKEKLLNEAWREHQDKKQVSFKTRAKIANFNMKYRPEGFNIDVNRSIVSKLRSNRFTENGLYLSRKQESLREVGRFSE